MQNKKRFNTLITLLITMLPILIFGQYFLVESLNKTIWMSNNTPDLMLNFIEKIKTIVLLTNCSVMLGIIGGIIYIFYIIRSLIKAIVTYKHTHPNDHETLRISPLLSALLGKKIMHYVGTEDTDKYKMRIKLLYSSLSLLLGVLLLPGFAYITLRTVPFSNLSAINQSLSNYKNNIFIESEFYIVTSLNSNICKLLDDDQFLDSNLKYKEIVAIDSSTNKTMKFSMPMECEFHATGTIFSTDINYYLELNNNNLEIAKESVTRAIEDNKDISKTLYKVSYVEGLNVVVSIEPIE